MSPTVALATIVAILRANEFKTRYMEFATAIMALIQYGLTVLSPKPVMGAAGDDPSDSELKECRAALEGFKDDSGGFGAAGNDPKALDPATLMMIVEFAVNLITAIIKRKKKPA